MSVMAGIWNLDGEPVDRNCLASISQYLADYGPDGETTHVSGPIALLYRPFHTTAESRLETQPHSFADASVITWDGRLDNRLELTTELWGAAVHNRPDVVIVAAAFERWGIQCLARLIGDWALALWNARQRELILARDFIGARNLFYQPMPRRIAWCSYLAGLASGGQGLSLSHEYVAGYFAFHPDAHLTPYREILSVRPGHFVRINESGITTAPHWTFKPRSGIRYKTDAEYEEHFREVFRQSVRRRLRTDSPVLAELSGGLDSSSIVCMADDILANDETAVPTLATFSCFDPAEPDEDDFCYFTKVEEKRRRAGFHAELRGIGDSFSLEYPTFAAIPSLGERREMKAARALAMEQGKYRVLLSGTGGDEFLGQTLDPRVYMADLLLRRRLPELWNQLMGWSLPIRRPWVQLLVQTSIFLAPTAVRAQLTPAAKVEPWIERTFARQYDLPGLLLDAPKIRRGLLPSVRERMHTVPSLGRQLTNTVPTIHEIRYPYLDQSLAEFLLSIPIEQLLRPGERRSLMRRAFVELLPPEVVARRTKAGAGRCYCLTLKKHWNELQNVLNCLVIAQLGFVNQRLFSKALEQMKDGHVTFTFIRLLRALVLEFWIRDAVSRKVISISPRPSSSPEALDRVAA